MEEYSAAHAETVEELKGWYWKKFEFMFAAYLKRKYLEEAKELKNSMIAGLWGNPNYDEKSYRQKALKDIEENYQAAIRIIYNGPEEFEIDMDQPLFSAMPDDLK